MLIHRIHGRDLREALQRAGRLHGTDAIVLGHEEVRGGVTVAVTDRRLERARRDRGRAEPARAGAAVARRRPADRAGVPARSGAVAFQADAPGLADVERALRGTGCSPRLIARVIEEIARSSARGAYALDRAAQLLGELLPVAPSPKVSRGAGGPCAVAFVGERGSGVTTTVVKLAGRLVKSRRRVALADVGTPHAAGEERDELGAAALALQVPYDPVRDAADLARVLERSRGSDAVLIDGTGAAGRDVAILRELRARLPRLRLEVYLTLPATAYRGQLDALAADHAAVTCTGLCLTRLDATRTPAPALEHALDTGRPLAFLCDGPDLSRHLHRPTPDRIADLFLRGRMA